ncbi:MAG: hypothetical protein K2N03_03450 [Muribaculaceae bacterium]|nr:hypothetical protein [Muribaculaceae bacterium]
MKTITRKLLGFAILAAPFLGYAQECDIEIAIANITKGEVVPESVNSRLEGKLTSALSKAGIVAAPYDAQFFVAGRFDNAYHDITGGPSQKVGVKTTLTLYIGDAENQKIFASETFDLKGVGNNDTQAYSNALNRISPSNTQLTEFLRKGKDKIVEYFDTHYQEYINNAEKAEGARNWDEALFYLNQIPACCQGYEQAQALAVKLLDTRMNHDSAKLLQQAEAAWAADPTESGAREAHKYLSQIDPASSNIAQAKALSDKIGKAVQKQWEFENVTKYKDSLEMEKLRMKETTERHRINSEVEKTRIRAVRDVARAYAQSRPRVVNRYVFIR